jgi:hypothetical protein
MDITSQVIDAINGWLQSLAEHLLRPALTAAGQLLFQTPAYDSIPDVGRAWSLVRDAADGLFVLALLAAGVLVMASGTFESRYSAKVLVPRIVLAAVSANASLAICGGLIRIDNALVQGLLGPHPGASTFAQLAGMIQGPAASDQVVGSLVSIAAAILAVLLVVLYIGRARLWWRMFSALLFVQVVQAVLVEVGLQLLRHTDWLGPVSDLTSGLVLITLLYLLFKLPFAAYQWAFRQRLSQSPVVQGTVATVRTVATAVATAVAA